MSDHSASGHPSSHAAADAAMATDPVCGMTVDPAAGKPSCVHDGNTYYFCGQGCCDKFVSDPVHYLSGAHRKAAEEAAAKAPPGTK